MKARQKKETDPWDADLSQTPALPKDWEHWVSKVGVPENYMFYEYTRRKDKTGYCTFCERYVPIREPRHNQQGVCPRCRHTVQYKAIGKAGHVVTDRYIMYLLQRCRDGVMIRTFEGYRHYGKGRYTMPRCASWEVRRVICDPTGRPLRAYYWAVYKQQHTRWIKGSVAESRYTEYAGKVYGKTLPHLMANELKTTGLTDMIQWKGKVDPERYLSYWQKHPYIEKIVKAGLYELASECLWGYESYGYELDVRSTEPSLTKMLMLDKRLLKRLRDNDGGKAYLRWLQYEKCMRDPLSEETIAWLIQQNIAPRDIEFISHKMSVTQIRHYIQRQMQEGKMRLREVLTTWSDYLCMATRLGMDTDDEIIYRVRKLRQRHDELVQRCNNQKDLYIRAGEILKTYPHVEENCRHVKDKFEYGDERYTVIVPTRIEDVIREGRNLHHCVDNDKYWDRMEHKESYVLFLRRTSEADKPHYTLEVEPGGTIRQVRTKFDRQEEDLGDAMDFLRCWQEVIAKRLTDKDRDLAKRSEMLRIQDLAKLREQKVLIRGGELAGKLLADVLSKDLLVNVRNVQGQMKIAA